MLRQERARAGLGIVLLLLGLAGTLALAPAQATQRRIEVYRPAARVADELLPVARAAMGGDGQATLDRGTNALILVGSSPSIEAALAALRELDRARVSVVLRYESRQLEDLDAHGVRIDWGAGGDGLRVGNVVFPGDATGVRVAGFKLRSESEGGLTGLVRVLDGETGRIGSGRTVPVHSRGLLRSDLAFVTAESGFEAQPRVLGDGRVQVQIRPVEAEVDHRGRVAFTEGATTVTVRPGETVALGGISRTSDEHASGSRVYSASRQAQTERVLLLTVDVESPAAPDASTEEGE